MAYGTIYLPGARDSKARIGVRRQPFNQFRTTCVVFDPISLYRNTEELGTIPRVLYRGSNLLFPSS